MRSAFCHSCAKTTVHKAIKRPHQGRICFDCGLTTIKAVKCVKFSYEATAEIKQLLKNFGMMCNEAIRIAWVTRPKNRFALVVNAYGPLKEYGLHTHYILSACEVAYASYSRQGRKSIPYFKRAFLKLDIQAYKLDYLLLRIPIQPKRFAYITLDSSSYYRSYLADLSLKRGSITLTEKDVVISFSREVELPSLFDRVGVDVNEENITASDTLGWKRRYNEVKDIPNIKERYRLIRAKISRHTHKDERVKNRLLVKYGERERNRTVQRVHLVSKAIVKHAVKNKLAINLENLKSIRERYRKGNEMGTVYRGRMNSWIFREVQRQIDYKASWVGIPISYVNPRGTSRNCPDCGSHVVNIGDRKLYCPKCDKIRDRDDLASENIAKMAAPIICTVRADRSLECSGDSEPRRQEIASNSDEPKGGSPSLD